MTTEKGHDTMSSRLDAYLETLGKVPPAIAAMNQADPQVLEGYLTMREAIMSSRDDGLPFKYKSLVFVILDLLAGNLDGAKLHLAAGLDAGLTRREVTEALLQTMMLHGVKTWGLGGHQLVDFADSYQREPPLEPAPEAGGD
jgi:alkylhydroperoxidase/carboxymuconolactone decarboxylase family protein YurZ